MPRILKKSQERCAARDRALSSPDSVEGEQQAGGERPWVSKEARAVQPHEQPSLMSSAGRRCREVPAISIGARRATASRKGTLGRPLRPSAAWQGTG